MSHLRALSKVAPLLIPRRQSRIAYVGATDMTNLGDRAMFEFHTHAFPGFDLIQFPSGSRNRLLAMYRTVYRQAPATALALGGGTLIGRPAYLRRLASFTDYFPTLPLFTIGVGVEDPSFGHGRTDWEAMSDWAGALTDFGYVSVRGPRSQEILSNVGIESSVIGDSALSLARPRRAGVETDLIGLNAGYVTDLWGDDLPGLMRTIAEFGRHTVERGKRVRVFTTWTGDVETCRELVRQIGDGAELVIPRTPEAVLSAVESCQVVVGLKLHAVVLAAAVGVPTVMIEYRPKCSDFHRTIGMDPFTVRSDDVTVGWLSDAVAELGEKRASYSQNVSHRVDELKRRIDSAAKTVRESLIAQTDG